jgi:hypothetical protein
MNKVNALYNCNDCLVSDKMLGKYARTQNIAFVSQVSNLKQQVVHYSLIEKQLPKLVLP